MRPAKNSFTIVEGVNADGPIVDIPIPTISPFNVTNMVPATPVDVIEVSIDEIVSAVFSTCVTIPVETDAEF